MSRLSAPDETADGRQATVQRTARHTSVNAPGGASGDNLHAHPGGTRRQRQSATKEGEGQARATAVRV